MSSDNSPRRIDVDWIAVPRQLLFRLAEHLEKNGPAAILGTAERLREIADTD